MRALACGVLALSCLAFASSSTAHARGARKPAKVALSPGMKLAQQGDCVAAVPLLEAEEVAAHRPAPAAALADCHVALGDLVLALDLWAALAKESPSAGATPSDREALSRAEGRAEELEARVPTIALSIRPEGVEAQVRAAGRSVDPSEPIVVPPDERIALTVQAEGYETQDLELLLEEGEHRAVRVELEPLPGHPSSKRGKPEASADEGDRPLWLGARYRGLLLPSFVMQFVGDGGTTAYLPGGALTLTKRVGRGVDLTGALGVQSYAAGPFPFKPAGAPDTEWEIVESNLLALTATLDVMWNLPLDDAENVTLRLGGGVGFGWAAFGDLVRTQAYPGEGGAGDPDTYLPCVGPNDPAGTFRYCNQLDKDATRYGEADRVWGDGGARPVVYPWLALPQIGLALRPVDELVLDVEVGASINGFLGGVGVRYEL